MKNISEARVVQWDSQNADGGECGLQMSILNDALSPSVIVDWYSMSSMIVTPNFSLGFN